MEKATINSPLGRISLEGDKDGISSIKFEGETISVSEKIPENLKAAVTQLEAYFSGQRTTFQLRLNPKGTEFQKKVWNELLQIPFGKTTSYQSVANRLGDPKVIRAAASANGKNPIAIIIPCHRIIGSDGSLTGYAGGLQRKKWLLDHESPVKQGELF
ncbi:MAG: cysteine methyltransferase [Alteromonas sp.]|nr:cysteine methyltransferase [Alteromonas sp.]MAY23883.1 cysteine methyltransferase [Flavobacteriaceae bacterium]|tara:strand:+ start:34135 stop:34608 length:474 start_codon:yes stop_codon:yes gene_type:complete